MHFSALEPGCIDAERRISLRFEVFNLCAKRKQRVYKVAYRTFAHAFFARKRKLALPKRKRGRKRAHRRTRVAEEQVHGAIHRYRLAAPFHYRLGIVIRKINAHAQLLQGLAHVARVVALKQVVQAGFPFREGRNQKSPVGNALGPREANLPAKRSKSR